MGNGGRGSLHSGIRHALASVAIFAQALMIAAPLVEVRDANAGPVAFVIGAASPDAPTVAAEHSQAVPHNAATCPACIAQSLHAQRTADVRLPTVVVVERTPTDRHEAVLPHHDPPSTHHSRAPPVVS